MIQDHHEAMGPLMAFVFGHACEAGRWLIKELLDHGYFVVAYDHSGVDLEDPRFLEFEGDLGDDSRIEYMMKEVSENTEVFDLITYIHSESSYLSCSDYFLKYQILCQSFSKSLQDFMIEAESKVLTIFESHSDSHEFPRQIYETFVETLKVSSRSFDFGLADFQLKPFEHDSLKDFLHFFLKQKKRRLFLQATDVL